MQDVYAIAGSSTGLEYIDPASYSDMGVVAGGFEEYDACLQV